MVSHQTDDNPYDLIVTHRGMAGKLRKGEKIPKRPLPEFEESGGFDTSTLCFISKDRKNAIAMYGKAIIVFEEFCCVLAVS